jgi:hypothetical protein
MLTELLLDNLARGGALEDIGPDISITLRWLENMDWIHLAHDYE